MDSKLVKPVSFTSSRIMFARPFIPFSSAKPWLECSGQYPSPVFLSIIVLSGNTVAPGAALPINLSPRAGYDYQGRGFIIRSLSASR